jgi:hypothetical protein
MIPVRAQTTALATGTLIPLVARLTEQGDGETLRKRKLTSPATYCCVLGRYDGFSKTKAFYQHFGESMRINEMPIAFL